MKTKYAGFAFLAVTASAMPVVFDAGISRFDLRGEYETNPTPSIVREDRRAWSPYFGTSLGVSSLVSARVGYLFIENLGAVAQYATPPRGPRSAEPTINVEMAGYYESDIHVVTFGPEFSLPISLSLTGFVSPEAQWVFERGSVGYSASQSAPSRTTGRNLDRVRVGGVTGVRYQFSRRWSVRIGFRYVDADPSWGRKARGIFVGVDFAEKRPNKSPEPTPTAVTPRAMGMNIETKKSKSGSNEARVAPAAVVAHL